MKRSLLVLFLLLVPIVARPQSRFVLKYGIVDTDFRKVESENLNRRAYGIVREYFPRKNGAFFFSYGLIYLRKANLIKYVDWSYDDGESVLYGRLAADVGFLEIPALFCYQAPVGGSNLFLAFATGLSLSMPIKDFSRLTRRREHYYGYEHRIGYSYTYWDEQGLESGMNALYSTALFYKKIGFELQYSRALGETLGFGGITVREYFDCWQFLARFSF